METCNVKIVNPNDEGTNIGAATTNIAINGEEKLIDDLFTPQALAVLQNVPIGKIIKNPAIQEKLKQNFFEYKNTKEHLQIYRRYDNGCKFSLQTDPQTGKRIVDFYDPLLKQNIHSDFVYKMEVRPGAKNIYAFRVGKGDEGFAYYFNSLTGAFKRVKLADIGTGWHSARRFKNSDNPDASFGDTAIANGHFSVFSNLGVIMDQDSVCQHAEYGTPIVEEGMYGAVRWHDISQIDKIGLKDISDIVKTRDSIEGEIRAIKDKEMLNPYYDVQDVWNRLQVIRNNLFNSLVLTDADIKTLNEQIEAAQQKIINTKFYDANEGALHGVEQLELKYGNNFLSDEALFVEAWNLGVEILNLHSQYQIDTDHCRNYLGIINYILDEISPGASNDFQNNIYYSNFNQNNTGEPASMSTFRNRAEGSFYNMLYNINDVKYKTQQPDNIIHNLLNTNTHLELLYE